jgi:hypothetical protein
MHSSKNSGTSRTFSPCKEKRHPTTAVVIGPFSPAPLVVCQFNYLMIGNCDIRKVLFVDWPSNGPMALVFCFVHAIPNFGANKDEQNPSGQA